MADCVPPYEAATLTLPGGRTVEIPVLRDAAGATFLDVRRLFPETGVCTFDPGFNSTASCESTITFIDGKNGRLLYRGYPIEDLAEHGDMVDCAHLLLRGALPTRAQRGAFIVEATHHRLVHENLIRFFHGFNHDAHPMAIMVGVVGALSAFYNDGMDIRDETHRDKAAIRVFGKITTIAAMAYKTAHGQPIVYPRDDLNFAENFLYMMFALPTCPYALDPVAARCLEVILMLHADHEQNASTSTVRIAGSSQANPFACIAAGAASLWGSAHGGANEAVLHMLEEIGSVENIPACVARAKDKTDSFRLMGFGHRLYKTTDPRAKVMRDMCHKLLSHLKIKDPLLSLAMELERVALSDEYFIKRKLYPNVDFYSGICFRALGIPVNMFTVVFAVGRSIGWITQWSEMAAESVERISRPRWVSLRTLRQRHPS
mmetsp:Transcript_9683/g.23916  ORF Transcript_9683/g.23916 Transcript_9683/m.23916 type:complete len:431 (-) Transcript_9683:597-1889(-)